MSRGRGRPKKHKIYLNVQVEGVTRDYITKLAKEQKCSQGDALDWIVRKLIYQEMYKSD